ncbi:MAG: type 1 periplasmic binding fold superfamily protein [Bacteroidia bacterium]|nr:type 1 periplasmic binding fold superfamily protein [Bacteroidia bacterium]
MFTSKKFFYGMIAILAISFSFVACEDEEPPIPNPEEVITTLAYTLIPDGGGADAVLSFEDLDGDGGNPPSYLTEPLKANTTYSGTLILLNKQETPAEDITVEIAEEDEDHQFFFELGGGANATIAYKDTDANGNPVGIMTTFTTGDAGSGTLKITLRHEPVKDATGVAIGDITNADGETDIEVTFDILIQ